MANVQSQVKNLINVLGIQHAADHLGVSYESIKSVFAGLKVRAGTMALVEQGLLKPIPKPRVRKKPVKKSAKKAKRK